MTIRGGTILDDVVIDGVHLHTYIYRKYIIRICIDIVSNIILYTLVQAITRTL